MSQSFIRQGLINAPCSESENSIYLVGTSNSTHEYKFVLNYKNMKRKNVTEKFKVKTSRFGLNPEIEKKLDSDLKRKLMKNANFPLCLKDKKEVLHISKKDKINIDFIQNSHHSSEISESISCNKNINEDFDESSHNDNQPSKALLSIDMFKRVGSLAKPLFECRLCYKQIKESSRKQHSNTHAGLRPFSCCYCESRFTRKGDAIRHRKTVHGNIKMLSCSVCNKKFSDAKHLTFHLQNHDKIFSYICTKCGFKFGKKEYFENHVRYIHPSTKVQSIIEINDKNKRGKKFQGLKLKNSELNHLNFPENCNKYTKEENVKCLYASNSNFKDLSDNEEYPCKYSLLDDSGSDDPVTLVKSGTISFSPKIECQTSPSEHYQKDEDLVNLAIKSAISQAKCTLEKLSTTSNFAIKLSKQIIDKTVNQKNSKKLTKNEFGCPEIHISANFSGVLRKFVIYVPIKTLTPLCKDGLSLISTIVNNICCGRGEIIGPVEITVREANNFDVH